MNDFSLAFVTNYNHKNTVDYVRRPIGISCPLQFFCYYAFIKCTYLLQTFLKLLLKNACKIFRFNTNLFCFRNILYLLLYILSLLRLIFCFASFNRIIINSHFTTFFFLFFTAPRSLKADHRPQLSSSHPVGEQRNWVYRSWGKNFARIFFVFRWVSLLYVFTFTFHYFFLHLLRVLHHRLFDLILLLPPPLR